MANNCVCVEKYDLLGCYAASSCSFLPTFRGNLSFPSSGLKNPKESLLPRHILDMEVWAEKVLNSYVCVRARASVCVCVYVSACVRAVRVVKVNNEPLVQINHNFCILF
jgi:hypothetical protein